MFRLPSHTLGKEDTEAAHYMQGPGEFVKFGDIRVSLGSTVEERRFSAASEP